MFFFVFGIYFQEIIKINTNARDSILVAYRL